jgi:hypothetical protein
MIRPITCVCFVLACGSGLYLYQSKHRVQVLDHEIEQTVHTTDALREQTRVLHAEWTLLNDPQRLQALADQFLNLKTVAPGQFTSMAELDNRIPAVRPPDPVAPPPVPQQVPVAQSPEITVPEEPQPPPVVAAIPTPPKAASVAAIPPPIHVADRKTLPPRPQLADVPSPRPPPFAPRPVAAVEPPHPTPPRIVPAALPVPQPTLPLPGSALGMAHNGAVPPPRPMPVSASQWVTSGGGG